MKKIRSFLLIASVAVSALSLQPSVLAQTNTPPDPIAVLSTNAPANFFQNLASWSTSRYASGLTWGTNTLDVATGGEFVNSLQWANYISVDKNWGNFYLGVSMDNAGIAGVISRVGGRVGYTVSNSGDLRVKTGIQVDYDRQLKDAIISPGLGLQKILTRGTYAEIWLTYPIEFNGNKSEDYFALRIGAGATF